MLALAHRAAALAAIALIAAFLAGTLAVETLAGPEWVARTKGLIVTPGLWLLIPALAATGVSGNRLARGRTERSVAVKRRRTGLAAANGLLVLVPCALVLDAWAGQALFDTRFYAVQALEVAAGMLNLTLLGLNLRDGVRLKRQRAAAGVAEVIA